MFIKGLQKTAGKGEKIKLLDATRLMIMKHPLKSVAGATVAGAGFEQTRQRAK